MFATASPALQRRSSQRKLDKSSSDKLLVVCNSPIIAFP
jgi:hypothetical protein